MLCLNLQSLTEMLLLTSSLFCSSGNMQNTIYQKPNSAIINCIIYTCAFPTVTCQNVFCKKGPLMLWVKNVYFHDSYKAAGELWHTNVWMLNQKLVWGPESLEVANLFFTRQVKPQLWIQVQESESSQKCYDAKFWPSMSGRTDCRRPLRSAF